MPKRRMEYYKLFQKVDIMHMNDFMKAELLKFGCPNGKIDIVRIWAKNDFAENLIANRRN